ncbi:MAG: PepSY domain-containing protein [Burkholderiaceae bacterium]
MPALVCYSMNVFGLKTVDPTRLLAACALALTLAAPAWADVSRDQAGAIAQSQTGGRVLSVEKAGSGNRPVWRVKVVTPQGEVRVVFIDATTGQGG